jgi:hypothetical protein
VVRDPRTAVVIVQSSIGGVNPIWKLRPLSMVIFMSKAFIRSTSATSP